MKEEFTVPRYGEMPCDTATHFTSSILLTGEISRELIKVLRYAVEKKYPQEFISAISNICHLADEQSRDLTAWMREELSKTPASTDNDMTDSLSLESKYIHHTVTPQ